MQEAHNCMRLRWWKYHFAGRGLEPRAASLALLEGGVVHSSTEGILCGRPTEEVLDEQLAAFSEALLARGVQGEVVDAHFILEQQTLLAGLIWAWTEVCLPALRAEYDIVLVERELEWEMAEGTATKRGLLDLVRPDVILRRRSDGRLFYREWKTTKMGGDDWAEGWEHTSQALANCMALEEVLKERIWGMQVEGMIKGKRQKETLKTSRFHGERIQHSPLCYGWKKDGAYQLATPRGGGWVRVRSWEEMPIREWVERVLTEDDRKALFISVPPVVPRRERMASWRRQETFKERRIARSLELCGPFPSEELLDEHFPQNEDHCHRYWGHPCAFEDACFVHQIGRDPVGSGRYQYRVPHHELERRLLASGRLSDGLDRSPTGIAAGTGPGSGSGLLGRSRVD